MRRKMWWFWEQQPIRVEHQIECAFGRIRWPERARIVASKQFGHWLVITEMQILYRGNLLVLSNIWI